MADSRNIVIELKLTGAGIGDEDSNKVPDEEEKKTFDKKAVVLLAARAIGDAAQIVQNAVSYEFGRALTLTENYKTQVQFSNAMTAINKSVSFGGTLLSAAVSGMTFGATVSGGNPIGAGIGAGIATTVAATQWAINEGMSIYQRFDQAGISLTQMNLQSSYAMSRLGLTDNGRGTQN